MDQEGYMDIIGLASPVVNTTPTQKRYFAVNTTWPRSTPVLTADEAVKAAKRLLRFALKRTFEVKVTSGNRHTWVRYGILYVNPENGWHDLVHDLSHFAHQRLHPGERPHSRRHASLERRLVKEVLTRGWLDGRLKKAVRLPKPKPDPRVVAYDRILVRIANWERKAKRAETALKKLNRQKKRFERDMSRRPTDA
jgi:hypothetical protein